MTPIQEKFIDEYCSKFGEISATQCAINAGYARDSAHTRAHELLDWRQHPEVRQEIDRRLEDTRKVWEIDRDKHLRKLNDIGRKADAKGLYGVSLKAEELRGKVNSKWKSLFKNREEMELTNQSMMEDVWGKEDQAIEDTKQLEKEANDARIQKELLKYQKARGNVKKT